MPQLKLNYFDFHGGRAEPARLALHMGGVAFEDHRFTFPEFAEFRQCTPFGQVPTLEVDGAHITQCDAILRYAGKLAGLYPTDPLQALLCDEVMYVVEEASVRGPVIKVVFNSLSSLEAFNDTTTARPHRCAMAAHGGPSSPCNGASRAR